MINIGALIDLVIAELTGANLLVGDGVAPPAGGWSEGQPNVDRFVAYTVVGSEGAIEAMPDLMAVQDWEFTLSLRHYGGSRKQLDHQATAARKAAVNLRRKTFDDPTKTVIGVTRWRLGAGFRVDDTDPPIWRSFDSVSLLCS